MNRLFAVRSLACLALFGLAEQGFTQDSKTTDAPLTMACNPIPLIEPGTKVVDSSEEDVWNRLVLVSTPKINSGDLDAISDSVRDAATACSLTIMATVKKSSNDQRYLLRGIGAGYSADGSSGSVVVSSTTASEHGVSLGFISNQVLKTNERQLAEVKVVAQTSQFVVFDARSVMYRRGANRKYVTRHLVSVDATNGNGAILTWLLVPTTKADETMPIIKNAIRVTPWGTKETRKVRVDGEQFNFLGVPGDLAFGLEDLPPGNDLQWTRRAARFAGRTSFTKVQAEELFDAMNQAVSAQTN